MTDIKCMAKRISETWILSRYIHFIFKNLLKIAVEFFLCRVYTKMGVLYGDVSHGQKVGIKVSLSYIS